MGKERIDMVTRSKLPKFNELGLFEIRLESIGGLGANLAGKMLAEAGVLHLGLNGSNFSSYGSEKKGSPVKSFIRFADPDTKIRVAAPIEEPHVVAVVHEALFKSQDCIAGLKHDGILLVNTTKTPEQVKHNFGLQSGIVVCVDALGIAVQERTRINTAMLGAICRVVEFISKDAVKTVIRETFEKKYPALVEANIRTFERGYSEVNIQSFVAESGETNRFSRKVQPLGYANQPIGGTILDPGNSIRKDLSASRQGYLPAFNREACIHCAACDQVCPDFCFVWSKETDSKGRTFQFLQGIDYQYCKGCMKCVQACPTDALSKMREEEGYAEQTRVKHQFSLIS
jgi:pyruvate ferredoxin oxidoreductase gamma subunit